MGAEWIGGAWSFGLDDPDDPLGAGCDEEGPRMGPVRLLQRTAGGFAPRPWAGWDGARWLLRSAKQVWRCSPSWWYGHRKWHGHRQGRWSEPPSLTIVRGACGGRGRVMLGGRTQRGRRGRRFALRCFAHVDVFMRPRVCTC